MKQGRPGAKVHFASLMDICHLKNAELEAKHQKYKSRVVLRGDIVKDDSVSYAVFTEQGSPASQMTAAKSHSDIISRLPGCAEEEEEEEGEEEARDVVQGIISSISVEFTLFDPLFVQTVVGEMLQFQVSLTHVNERMDWRRGSADLPMVSLRLFLAEMAMGYKLQQCPSLRQQPSGVAFAASTSSLVCKAYKVFDMLQFDVSVASVDAWIDVLCRRLGEHG